MKTKYPSRLALPLAAIGGLGAAGVAAADHRPPAPPASERPPAGAPAPPSGEAPARPSEEKAVSLQEKVDRLLRNREGAVDGLLLANGTKVKAPRHAIRRDLSDLDGRTVNVSGYLKPAKVGHATIVVDGQTIDSPRHARPEVPEGENRVQRSGKVTSVTRGPRSEANGIVLDDGTRVGVPHHVDAAALIGKTARVDGYLKPAEVKHATVTSGGQTYIRDEGPGRGAPRGGAAPPAPVGHAAPRKRR